VASEDLVRLALGAEVAIPGGTLVPGRTEVLEGSKNVTAAAQPLGAVLATLAPELTLRLEVPSDWMEIWPWHYDSFPRLSAVAQVKSLDSGLMAEGEHQVLSLEAAAVAEITARAHIPLKLGRLGRTEATSPHVGKESIRMGRAKIAA
jgi:hypothetical protein